MEKSSKGTSGHEKPACRSGRQADQAYSEIRRVVEQSRNRIYSYANFQIVLAYWNIGRIIVEQEQKGRKRAIYGEQLIKELSSRLTEEFGRGFDESNLRYFRMFYLEFPICDALRHELTWTHYRILLKVQKEESRKFYMLECISNRWSARELNRQMNSLLYERLALCRDRKKTRELSLAGQEIHAPKDIIKEPYVLEFLGIKQDNIILEKDLETRLVESLRHFLLELGKGFSFVARQKRIAVGDENFYVDLVFYHHILKCFVLIDLKVGKLTHSDIGQMDFYVRYFDKEAKSDDDNPTIGIILCTDKNKTMVKYTLLDKSQRLFASKYRLYLPSEEELKREIEEARRKAEG